MTTFERYELVEGKSSKFWEVATEGATLMVRYGRIGTGGQSNDKELDSAESARAEMAKLIKAKTRKGYALAGRSEQAAPSAEETAAPPAKPVATQAEPAEAASEPAKPAPTGLILDETKADFDALMALALPSRSRPAAPMSAEQAWDEFSKHVAQIASGIEALGPSRSENIERYADMLRDFAAMLKQIPEGPARLSESDAAKWLDRIGDCANHRRFVYFDEGKENTRYCAVLLLTLFCRWLIATHGVAFAARVTAPLMATLQPWFSFETNQFSRPLALAMRDALSALDEAEFEIARAEYASAAATADWDARAAMTFALADDRGDRHDLQPETLLCAADNAGMNVTNDWVYLALLCEAPARAVEKWRESRYRHLYFDGTFTGTRPIAATAIAAARHNGDPALPVLGWLLGLARDEIRTELARIILQTREPGALNLLLPELHDEFIRAALKEVGENDPGLIFHQACEALAAGKREPALVGLVNAIGQKYGADACRGWLQDSPALRWFATTHAGLELPVAALADMPAVLRDPPWRKTATAKKDLVLSLTPIPTPFSVPPGLEQEETDSWRISRAVMIETPEDLRKFAGECVSALGERADSGIPVPAAGASQQEILDAVIGRMKRTSGVDGYELRCQGWTRLAIAIADQPEWLALELWKIPALIESYSFFDSMIRMAERYGEKAAEGLALHVDARPVELLEMVRDVDAPGIALAAARVLFKLKTARRGAAGWLSSHPRTAAMRLIPEATGAAGAARENAENALRWLARETPDGAAIIGAAAQEYAAQDGRAPEAVAQVMNRDPLQLFPRRIPKLPGWLDVDTLARPVLKTGAAMPGEGVVALLEMLSFSQPGAVYPGVGVVRETVTADSLAAFGWSLLSSWLAEGAPSKEGWALRCLGWIGNDDTARDLTRLIRLWPGESAHARAVTGLDVLADIGSDIALMNLNGIAEKLKFKGLQSKAREKIAAIAEARDLTENELADRLAPDLGLDERGGMDLDFGPRAFRVGFDEFLKPWVRSAEGKRLANLPKPNKSDDAERAGAAAKSWSTLKKDARAIASLQLLRLENMLSSSRRVAPDAFWTFFASHPLIRHLTQRLVWGVYPDAAPASAPSLTFRVLDDLSLGDKADEPVGIDFSAGAEGLIGLVHPLQVAQADLDDWGALLGDYEITQPFAQLDRDTHALTGEEKTRTRIGRFEGIKVENTRLRGMPAYGWALGQPEDGGVIGWVEREITLGSGETATAYLSFSHGIYAGAMAYEEKLQELQMLSIERPYGPPRGAARTFGELDPIAASEMLRGLIHLAETAP